MTEDRKTYPKERSIVTVTFKDGEIVEYEIDAGPGIARYLAQEAGHSGVLTLHEWGVCANCIPLDAIRNWEIKKKP